MFIGINPDRVFEAADQPPLVTAVQPLPDAGGEVLALGTRRLDQDSNEYILLEAPAAIATQGNLGFWNEDFLFDLVSTADDIGGTPLAGNVGLPTAAGDWFWAIIEGMGPARVLASAAADVALETTATAGALDDSVTVGSFVVEGLTLMTANGGSTGSVNARYSHPHLAYLARA